jgi:hypothetical protein
MTGGRVRSWCCSEATWRLVYIRISTRVVEVRGGSVRSQDCPGRRTGRHLFARDEQRTRDGHHQPGQG